MITFDEPSHINSNTLKYMTFNQMWAFVCAPVSLWLSHSERHELDITPLKEQGMHWLPPNVMDLLFISPLSHYPSPPLLVSFWSPPNSSLPAGVGGNLKSRVCCQQFIHLAREHHSSCRHGREVGRERWQIDREVHSFSQTDKQTRCWGKNGW